jgi:uncharacterized protein (DUF1810 family)
MPDPFDLQRFVDAQAPVWTRVRAELSAGAKASHWMWFIFPQIEGLGFSAMAQRYAVSGLDEARAYLAHPVLGPRLREAVGLLLAVDGRTARQVMGQPDDVKLRSCLTLFAHAAPAETAFREALAKYFAGEEDPATLARL